MDRDLVIQARAGDHDAFARLAAGSIGRLNAVARLILHDAAQAEDAVQEAFLDAWRGLRSLREPDRFDAWLNRLLIRACSDARAVARRRRVVELPLLPTDDVPTRSTESVVADADQLERGLRQLTIDQRTVLVLTFYLDLSLADAAATLGIPVGTMKSRLNRSIAALRAVLDAEARRSGWPMERPA